MKFNKNSIEICGDTYKFKKVSSGETLRKQEQIEAEYKKYEPLFDKSEELNDQYKSINNQIKQLNKMIDAINRKDDPTDTELDLIITYSQKALNLEEERNKINKQGKQLDKENDKELKQIQKGIFDLYGEMAEMQLEKMTKDYFVENCSRLDLAILRLLPQIRDMCETGVSEKKIEKFVRDNIEADADQTLRNKKPSFQ